MGLRDKLNRLAKQGSALQRQKIEAERRRSEKAAEQRRLNDEASRAQLLKSQAQAIEHQRAAAASKQRQKEREENLVRWSATPDKHTPFYLTDPHPYRGAKQITVATMLHTALRFDAEALEWINSHLHSPTVQLRIVTRTGGLCFQNVPRAKLPTVLKEYKIA
jgi:hypothetical protein